MVKKLTIFVLPKSAKRGYCALIGARGGETLSRHVINFEQW